MTNRSHKGAEPQLSGLGGWILERLGIPPWGQILILVFLSVAGVFGSVLWSGYLRLAKIESAVRVLASQQPAQQKDLIRDFLSSSRPQIKITSVNLPRGGGPDSMTRIEGEVAGATELNDLRVVVFARTDRWYVQPSPVSPYTSISADGRWATETHLGLAYAAVLIKSSYTLPAATDALPSVSGPVLAVDSFY